MDVWLTSNIDKYELNIQKLVKKNFNYDRIANKIMEINSISV